MTSLLRDAFTVRKTNAILRYSAVFILPRCYRKTECGIGGIYGGLWFQTTHRKLDLVSFLYTGMQICVRNKTYHVCIVRLSDNTECNWIPLLKRHRDLSQNLSSQTMLWSCAALCWILKKSVLLVWIECIVGPITHLNAFLLDWF